MEHTFARWPDGVFTDNALGARTLWGANAGSGVGKLAARSLYSVYGGLMSDIRWGSNPPQN